MSQFNYLNEINSFITMDGEIKRGPVPRWQKKLEASTSNLNLNGSVNASRTSVLSSFNATSSLHVALSKTPGKSDGKCKKEKNLTNKIFISKVVYFVGRKTPTPNKVVTPSGGDRFIPNRSTTNFELGHYLVS